MSGRVDADLSSVEYAILMEEGVARVSHQLRNHLAAVRNAAFYVAKRVGRSELSGDATVAQFLRMIEEQLAHASGTVVKGAASAQVRAREPREVAFARVLDEVLAEYAQAANALPVTVAIEPVNLIIDAREMRLALLRVLLAARAESGASALSVRGTSSEACYTVEVGARLERPAEADVVALTELHWTVARRVCVLHGAELVRTKSDHELKASLIFPLHEAELGHE